MTAAGDAEAGVAGGRTSGGAAGAPSNTTASGRAVAGRVLPAATVGVRAKERRGAKASATKVAVVETSTPFAPVDPIAVVLGLLDAVARAALADVENTVVVAVEPPVVAAYRAGAPGQSRGVPVPVEGARRLAWPVPAIVLVADAVVIAVVVATPSLGEAT